MKRTQMHCHHGSFARNGLTDQSSLHLHLSKRRTSEASSSKVFSEFQTVLSTESPRAVMNLADFIIFLNNTLISPLLLDLCFSETSRCPGMLLRAAKIHCPIVREI